MEILQLFLLWKLSNVMKNSIGAECGISVWETKHCSDCSERTYITICIEECEPNLSIQIFKATRQLSHIEAGPPNKSKIFSAYI